MDAHRPFETTVGNRDARVPSTPSTRLDRRNFLTGVGSPPPVTAGLPSGRSPLFVRPRILDLRPALRRLLEQGFETGMKDGLEPFSCKVAGHLIPHPVEVTDELLGSVERDVVNAGDVQQRKRLRRRGRNFRRERCAE